MRPAFILLALLSLSGTACQSPKKITSLERPLTAKTVGPAYVDFVLEVTDKNQDNQITQAEWLKADGAMAAFVSVDRNKDGIITRTELIQLSSRPQFFDTVRRYADFNKDNQLTPREFRSPAGVRLLRHEF